MPEALKDVNWVAIIAFVAQLVGLVVWAVHVEDKAQHATEMNMMQNQRIDIIDDRGSKRTQILEERQNQFRIELDALRQQLNGRR